MFIQIFGRDGCGYCDAAISISKSYVERNHCLHNYVYKKLDKDFTRDEFIEKFSGVSTFPQVIVNGKNIGGYTELKQYLESKK